jgi:PAS domain S-box-containing protein
VRVAAAKFLRSKRDSRSEMSLAQKTSAIVLLTVVGLTIALYAATRVLIMRSFLQLEQNQTRNAVERARNALDDNASSLATTANDYAAWTPTYNFMRHISPIKQEFQDASLRGLGINSVLLLDKAGRIAFFKEFDFTLNQELIVPPKIQAALASDPWVRKTRFLPESGIMNSPDGPVLIAACPILTTQHQGPSLGMLLMTRNLDTRLVEQIRAVTRSSVTIAPYSSPLRSSHKGIPIAVTPVNAEVVAGSEILADVGGRPILELRLEAPRTVYQQGLESLRYLLAALCIASAVLGAVSLSLLRLAVLGRIIRLSAEVDRIGGLKDLAERVVVEGDDELARLAAAINHMLEALQDSDLQFRNIAENIHQVFWVLNAETGNVEYVSLAYESLWGRPRDEVYRNPLAWTEAIHPDDRALVQTMREHLQRGMIGASEFRIVRPDGGIRWICDRYFPVKDEQGKLKQVAGLAEDITEFKKAEQVLLRSQQELERLVQERTVELAKANVALAEKQEHFRQLFATIPVPVWLFSESTYKFLEVNEAAVDHYGYSREEFLQMTIEEIRPAEEIERLRRDLAESREPRSFSRGWKHRTKDGRLIDVEISSLRVHFADVPAVLVAAHDVTDRMRMEVELRHGQKLQAVGELAAGVAHEINTPIQFVGNNVEFLQNAVPNLMALLDSLERAYETFQNDCSKEVTEEVRAAHAAADLEFLRKEIPTALEQTVDGVQRVTTIVQALKKFSHVDSGPEKAPANLNEALQSTLIVAGNELKYVADMETVFGDLPLVRCHLGDLNQVFLNLLVNAAHAIGDVAKERGRGRIRVETKIEEEWAVIAIGDSGTGIPVEVRSRIFDPFFTTKAVGKGTGQGLALARAIVVEKHGGTLTFETELGKGTTFYIRIPLVAPEVAKEEIAVQE